MNYHAADPIAWSTSTDPEKGLVLNFYTQSNGLPLFVQPPGITMGPDDIPNSGINLSGQIYLICNTGSDVNLANPQGGDYSELVQFNESAQTFSAVRMVSPAGGKFIGTSMHASTSGSTVYIFGAGPYRASDIYLQQVSASSFTTGSGTQYFAGLVNGQPTWTAAEAGTVPVVQDNPLNGPAWPNDNPTVGNLSVTYSSALNLWLMTYDGGRQPGAMAGTYFTYATQPWGPWATPQLIFHAVRDGARGLGGYIHDASVVPDPPGDGLNGPVIGSNNPYTTDGGGFAPLMIERFTTVSGSTLKIYYNLSTWNPYVVVRLRSEFAIGMPGTLPAITPGGVVPVFSSATSIQQDEWASIYGTNLASGTYVWKGDFPTTLSGTSVTVDGKPAYLWFASPTQINFQVPDDAGSGPVPVVVQTQTGSTSSMVTLARAAPAFLLQADNKHVLAIVITPGAPGNSGAGYDIVGPARPVKAGEILVLYGVGFGPTKVQIPAGQAYPGATSTTNTPQILIGGVLVPQTDILFSGLVSAGLYQLNVQVPPNLGTGDRAIVTTIAGVQTQNNVVVALQ